MNAFQLIIGKMVRLLLSPFRSLDPLWPLLSVSLGITLVFLLVFRRLANPSEVQVAKDRIQAHILELRLFKDSPRIIFSALANILSQNALYLRSSLKPLLVMLFPTVLLLVHLDSWFGYKPLGLGEGAVVTIKVSGTGDSLKQAMMEAPPGISVETPPLRIPTMHQVSWAIRAKEEGIHRLVIHGLGQDAAKTVVVSDDGIVKVWPDTVAAGFWNEMWNPGEATLNPQSRLQEVTVSYSARQIRFWHWELHWLLVFFIASCIFGWIASRWMKIVI